MLECVCVSVSYSKSCNFKLFIVSVCIVCMKWSVVPAKANRQPLSLSLSLSWWLSRVIQSLTAHTALFQGQNQGEESSVWTRPHRALVLLSQGW